MKVNVGLWVEEEEIADLKRLARMDRNTTAIISMARLGAETERARQQKSAPVTEDQQ